MNQSIGRLLVKS